MANNHSLFSLYGKSPLYQLFVSLLIIMGVGILLLSVLLLAGILIFNADLGIIEFSSAEISEKQIGFIRYLLISQHISLFIVPAIIILNSLKPEPRTCLTELKMPRLNEVVLVIVLAFCIFPITGFAGQLNSGLDLPDWLSGVEKWMIEKEEDANSLIDMVIEADTFWVMILNIFIIAVIPAIGEELIFRGVFQRIFYDLFKSGHVAVWVTAFVFSAIHFQFFGFVPRFILGLVFGYLFLWSGTLWLPVISHFVNNAVAVAGANIQGWEDVISPPDISLWKTIVELSLAIIISILILLYFRNKSKNKAAMILDEF